MLLKNPSAVKRIMSFEDQKQIAKLFQLFSVIDKRVRDARSRQKKAPTPGREVGSLKKRAYLILVALGMVVAALLLVQLQYSEPTMMFY